MRRSSLVALVVLCILLTLAAYFYIRYSSFRDHRNGMDRAIPDSVLFTSAPVLTPQQVLRTFRLAEEGFSIELVASEPLVHDPIAMTFDEQGRIWVVEMRSYMNDIAGSGEGDKVSRIVILEDINGDGRMDSAKVFLDSLVMPRAIAITNGGVLVAEPPNLWFVENHDDVPGKKILIDASYAVGGNAEHQANGLLRGIDNWYYNAKSKKRYRFQDGQWLIEETEFRGQWGITKDNYGRLFYNTNSNQLRGDLVPPNMLSRNPDFDSELGVNVEIAADQQVYPIRPTPGINRGYQEGMLNEVKKLRHFTAACGPEIYRGDNFPKEYLGNAFVCEPAANLIKRNIIFEDGIEIRAEQAYEDREFLASTDERFRPVNLYNGPDGGLYVVDMYKGIIQHETYLTDYLQEQIEVRGLEKPLGMGRIYRIIYQKNDSQSGLSAEAVKPALDQASDLELVRYLSHPNGWWRDKAQSVLIERNSKAIVPEIMDLLRTSSNNNYQQVHALWTLEGMGIYTPELVRKGVKDKDEEVIATALRIGEKNKHTKDAAAVLGIYESVVDHSAALVHLQLAFSLGEFIEVDSGKVLALLLSIAEKNKENALIQDAIISSLYGKERQFLTLLRRSPTDNAAIIERLDKITENAALMHHLTETDLSATEREQYVTGKYLYEETCSGCHAPNGAGLVPIAPPLAGSEWVVGPEERVALIVLHGLKGPVTVKGKVYKTPEIQPVMPGLINNREMTDENLAALLTYIRNSWGNKAEAVRAEKVSTIRNESRNRKEPFTEDELLMVEEQ